MKCGPPFFIATAGPLNILYISLSFHDFCLTLNPMENFAKMRNSLEPPSMFNCRLYAFPIYCDS